MSVNITVHANPQPSPAQNPFASLDSVRKAENEKRRRLRLEQVRQQSKELAAKVRKNFKTAKQQELAKVVKVRQGELDRWKQRNIAKLQSEYQHCLEDVGEAHKAAEAAEQCEVWFQEKKAAQQAAALTRGKQAEVKLAEQIQERESRKVKKRKDYKPCKSVGTQVNPLPEKPLVEQRKQLPVQILDDSTSSTTNTPSAFEQFRKGTKSVPDLRTIDRAVSPGFLTDSDEELMMLHSGKNKENIPSQPEKQVDTLYYNANSFTSPETLLSKPSAAPAPLKPFTQVSDLIKRRHEKHSQKPQQPLPPSTTYSSQKNVQFDAQSENTLSFPTSTDNGCSLLESPRKPVRKLLEHPKAPPSQQTVASSKRSVPSHEDTSSSKVQYYDYQTKYRKEYSRPSSLVQRNEKVPGELNAMQEAARFERLQEEMLAARKKAPKEPDRSKVALEKLQTRKDYENLKAELDKLMKAESQTKSLNPSTKPVPPEHRQRQRSEQRQQRMNEAVEDLFKQRVLITCPKVRQPPQQGVQPPKRSTQINVASATGKKSAATVLPGDEPAMLNSSDSCSTIMLGLDPTSGVSRAGIPLPSTKHQQGDKVAQLKDLLEQINQQKKLLTEELEKEELEEEVEEANVPPVVKLKSTKSQTDNGIKKMQERQAELEEQHRKLREKEQEIRELEKQLKEKMNRLEKDKNKPRVPIHVETRGAVSAEVLNTSSTGSNDSVKSGSDLPVKIVITVNDKSQKKIKKTPKKSGGEAVRKRKKAKEPVEEPKEQPVTPAKPKENLVKQVPAIKPPPELEEQSPISSTTSTIYRQLPVKMDNRIGQLMKQLAERQALEPAPADLPKEPTKRSKPVPKHQLQKTVPPAIQQTPLPPGQKLNPTLLQYIVRLLGMSRQSIEQLGVSSTTSVSTPHESVVNVSTNASVVEETLGQDTSRVDRLRKFIDDNYNFLSEIDETLKEHDLTAGSADENISRVEDIWMRTLNRKEREVRAKGKPKKVPPVEQSTPVMESPLKSILKSPKKTPSKIAKIITPQGHVEVINLSDREEKQVLEKYSQLTENCSKRISELSEMIQKVREEKRKLIENSLSSSEHQESSTKYMDLPAQQKKPAITSVETSPRSTRDDPVSEEIREIFTTGAAAAASARQIGLSKDSGIAMSRPVTSSDFRDSPDTRPPNAGAPQFESSEDLSGSRDFEPLLGDIPKVPARVSPPNNEVQLTGPLVDPKEATSLAKRTKPPAAISRFSPQLEEANAAHELSTIIEVPTPLTSKINISVPPSEKLDPAEQLLLEARDKLLEHARAIGYEGFPKYEEYLRLENLDGTRFDPEKTSQSRLNELLEVTGKSDLLRYQKFPLAAPEMNLTQKEDGSNSSSSASLPDVVAELKLRNIIDKSFNNSLDDSNRSSSESEHNGIAQPVPPAEQSPTKKRHSKKSANMNQDQSASDATESLGRDLNKLGLRWASSMLRKNQEVLLQDHSSSSSLSLVEDIRKNVAPSTNNKSTEDPNSSQPQPSGKPLNLKEFIARELMIRTQSDLSSLSDSSSPCSLLLRSLLDISNINTSTPDALTHTTTDKNVQRTSTPVAASKSSSSNGNDGGAAGTKEASINGSSSGGAGLFSGESRISSVHLSSSSGGENRLSVPKMRLDVDKFLDELVNGGGGKK